MANHGLVAFRVKFFVISRFDVCEFLRISVEWISTTLKVVPEIGHEFLARIELDYESLVVDW